jgi:hypothetical protein
MNYGLLALGGFAACLTAARLALFVYNIIAFGGRALPLPSLTLGGW